MDPSSNALAQRKTPDYTLDLFADATSAKDVTKAVLHTIFFHRYFTPITPISRDLLDLTLPAIDDVDLETLIDQRAAQLVRELSSDGSGRGFGGIAAGREGKGRGQLAVQFYEKKRRKGYFGFGKQDEDFCWEQWTLDVTLAVPRTETGRF